MRSASRLIVLLAACCVPLFATGEEAAKPAFKPPLGKVSLEDGDSIVFLGDSITHQCLYTQYVEDFLYTRFPKLRLKTHNAGVGGARAWDALARFERDVAAYKPKYVTILLGMNDGSYRPYDEATFKTYRDDMTKVLEEIAKIGATPILMTPTMFDARAARLQPNNKRDPENVALYNSTLAYYGAWLRETAVEGGFGFVNMWTPLNDLTLQERKTDPNFTLIRDAVHPDAPGQVIMAMAVVNDLGLKRQVSTIHIDVNAPKQKVRSPGGKVSDVSITDEEISFTFEASSLPWVLPAEAQSGAKLANLGHRLSQESLEAHGLASGKYTLTIDGVEVGQFTSAQLEKHIELQANDKTPEYQQALKIAELNKQRNDGPVKGLRGEWGKFQGYARKRREVEMNPENQAAKDQLATMEKQQEGREDRIADFEKKAGELEEQIRVQQVIPARKYVLKKKSAE
jgi:lysophospholipase L1-like esterase